MDEISIHSATHVAEVRDGGVREYVLEPRDYGIERQELARIAARDATESLAIIHRVFADERGPAHDIVALNAGATIYISGMANDIAMGIAKARQVLADGGARDRLARFVAHTQALKAGAA
jgi:anthranilate phosphoribosyltransferase